MAGPIGPIRWYFRRVQARRRGRYDGAQGVPAPAEASAFPPGEFRLKQTADREFEKLARRWSQRDMRLKGRYCARLREVRMLKVALTEAEYERRRLEDAHEENVTSISLERKVRYAKRGREQDWRMSPLAYGLFMGAVLIGEFPLNAIAFRLFGEAELLTYVMTLVLAASLVGSAHILGILISLEHPTRVQLGLLGVCIAAPLGAIAAIAMVRQAYVTGLGQAGISPGAVTAAFVLINLLIFTMAAVLSYFTHDPVARQIRATEAPLRQFKRRMARLQRRRERLEIHLQYMVAARQKALQAVMHEAQIFKNEFQELFQEYRMGNLEGRAEKVVPPIFTQYPEFTLPLTIQVLDWYCPEVPDLVSTSQVLTSSRQPTS
jgi:ABC-type multidrug transport system fused ATPase/permease subunit